MQRRSIITEKENLLEGRSIAILSTIRSNAMGATSIFHLLWFRFLYAPSFQKSIVLGESSLMHSPFPLFFLLCIEKRLHCEDRHRCINRKHTNVYVHIYIHVYTHICCVRFIWEGNSIEGIMHWKPFWSLTRSFHLFSSVLSFAYPWYVWLHPYPYPVPSSILPSISTISRSTGTREDFRYIRVYLDRPITSGLVSPRFRRYLKPRRYIQVCSILVFLYSRSLTILSPIFPSRNITICEREWVDTINRLFVLWLFRFHGWRVTTKLSLRNR